MEKCNGHSLHRGRERASVHNAWASTSSDQTGTLLENKMVVGDKGLSRLQNWMSQALNK